MLRGMHNRSDLAAAFLRHPLRRSRLKAPPQRVADVDFPLASRAKCSMRGANQVHHASVCVARIWSEKKTTLCKASALCHFTTSPDGDKGSQCNRLANLARKPRLGCGRQVVPGLEPL